MVPDTGTRGRRYNNMAHVGDYYKAHDMTGLVVRFPQRVRKVFNQISRFNKCHLTSSDRYLGKNCHFEFVCAYFTDRLSQLAV